MKKFCPLHSDIGVLALFLIAILLMHSCSWRGTSKPPSVGLTVQGGSYEQKLRNLASSLKSITVTGRLYLTFKKEQLPSVKIKAYLLSKPDGSFLRVKGFGPFGVTVFDLLAKGNRAWIYLPRQGKYYSGSRFFTEYGNLDVRTAVTIIEMLLNPWVPARLCHLKAVSCKGRGEDYVCFKGSFLGKMILFVYHQNLSPKSFLSEDVELNFKSQMSGNDIYPKEASFIFKKGEIWGNLKIDRVTTNSLPDENVLFNESYFTK